MSGCQNSKKKPELRPETVGSTVSRAELEVLRQKAVELSIKNPQKAAIILSDWLKQPAGAGVRRKKSG